MADPITLRFFSDPEDMARENRALLLPPANIAKWSLIAFAAAGATTLGAWFFAQTHAAARRFPGRRNRSPRLMAHSMNAYNTTPPLKSAPARCSQ